MKLFAKNLNRLDRAVRVLIGSALLLLTVIGPRTAWGLVGLVPLLTAGLGSCPLYSLLGIASCPVRRRELRNATR